jgi:AraC family transcriptional activator of pobA
MTGNIPAYALYGEETGPGLGYFIHCETIEARSAGNGWRIRPHRHPHFFQFLYISGGESQTALQDQLFHQAAGTAITMPAGTVHGFRFSQDIDGHVITILAEQASRLFPENARVARWFDRPHVVSFPEGSEDRLYFEQSINRFASEFDARRQDRDLCLDIAFRHLLMQIYRLGLNSEGGGLESDDLEDDRLARLVTLINERFREHRPVSFYAAETGISATHLNRLCHETFGEPVSGLITRRVMQEAKRYLLFSARSIQEVAFELGFTDPCYFSRYFSRHAGCSPQAFRREHQGMTD